jgi:hypothetical protein
MENTNFTATGSPSQYLAENFLKSKCDLGPTVSLKSIGDSFKYYKNIAMIKCSFSRARSKIFS